MAALGIEDPPVGANAEAAHVAAEDGYELGWDRHAASGLGGPVLEPAFLVRRR